MTNPNVVVRAMLLADPAMSALVGDHIYSPKLSKSWKPEAGGAISLFVRGGTALDLYVPIVEPSVQVVAWAGSAKDARSVMDAVLGVLHNAPDQIVQTVDGPARLLWGKAQVYPQDVTDSETQYPTCVCFFSCGMYLNLLGE